VYSTLLLLFVFFGVAGFFLSWKHNKQVLMTLFLSLILFFLALLPILNLYFLTLQNVENDRYSYFASVFFSLFLAGFFTVLFQRWSWFPSGIFLLISLFYLQKTNIWWRDATSIHQHLVRDFRWYDKDYVFVLNAPDDHHGILMQRIIGAPSSLKDDLADWARKPFKGQIVEILHYNLPSVNQGAIVKQVADNELFIECKEWGSWWMFHDYGNTIDCKRFFEIKRAQDKSYSLILKEIPLNSAFIYQDGNHWEEFVLRKKE
jgi:hypothetical protein